MGEFDPATGGGVWVAARATEASSEESGVLYRFLYVDQEGFERHLPKTFAALAASFTDYQGD